MSLRPMTRLAAGLLLLGLVTAVQAEDRYGFTEENDALPTGADRHYTQGLRLDYAFEPASRGFWHGAFDGLATLLPMFGEAADARRLVDWTALGQSIFTPKDLNRPTPDPTDRPYAGWLYTGLSLAQENGGRRYNSLELLAGVTGPLALARETQDAFHRLLGLHNPGGYSHQLANRGAGQFSYQHAERLAWTLDPARGVGIDAIPEAGVSLGSVFRYIEAGTLLRIGDALDTDYGPTRVRPGLSGARFFDASRVRCGMHGYAYAGVQIRRVFYDAFIDRAVEVAPPGLVRKPWVSDYVAGAVLEVHRWLRIDFTAVRRSSQFAGQHGADVFGSTTFSTAF